MNRVDVSLMNNTDYRDIIEKAIDKVESWSDLPAEPLVSVWMITYNHERYIRQALNGVLMQQTSFEYEVVIGDDDSTDQTRQIILDYQKRHPDRIRLRLAKTNLYRQKIKQSVGVWQACRGKYLAVCEGDDYWTDPYKLQKQVDFLESHCECALCFHAAYAHYQDTFRSPGILRPYPVRNFYSLRDLLVKNFVPNLTTMTRSGLFKDLPDWYFDQYIGDWPLHLLNARYGAIGYIDEPMAVYRIHSGGIFSGATDIQRLEAVVSVYRSVYATLGTLFDEEINAGLSLSLLSMAVACLGSGKYKRAASCIVESQALLPQNHGADWCNLSARLLLSSVYHHLKSAVKKSYGLNKPDYLGIL
jgi:glycosyltransferase involved in cell wall biosynthesis